MLFTLFSLSLVFLAALPAFMVIRNLTLFERAGKPSIDDDGEEIKPIRSVSILIPARNEADGIAAAVESIAAGRWKRWEVIVMDDHSTDQTAAIVKQLANDDNRIKLAHAPDLPAGWNGKQHACWCAAQLAQSELLLFMDADVRLRPDALERYVYEFENRKVKLLSGFPNQELGTPSESMLIPLMYVVLLGYLPLDQMRKSCKPEFGAGCGQLFLAEKEAYFASGGHQSIAESRHDGLKLPRSFRAAGAMTDLFDASDIATVRMYRGWQEVTRGLLKNATEGIANRKLILLFTMLLLGGFTLPILSFAHALFYGWPLLATSLLGCATGISFVPRLLLAQRLQHSMWTAVMQPLAVLLFVSLQWIAFLRQSLGGGTVAWRGRH